MANSTSAIKRIVLDANVLLTGLFVPQSKSREVILAVLRGELIAYVIENTIEESEGVIARAARETGVDLLQSFRDAIRIIRLITLPRISRDQGRAYSAIKGRGDKALAAAAFNRGVISIWHIHKSCFMEHDRACHISGVSPSRARS